MHEKNKQNAPSIPLNNLGLLCDESSKHENNTFMVTTFMY